MKVNQQHCFVVMPFASQFDDVFEGISHGLAPLGFNVTRIDRSVDADNLIREMIRHICEAQVVVADITGVNANVFYELGIAHSTLTGADVLIIAQKETEIPFDIRPYKVLLYETGFSGIRKLANDVGIAIGSIQQSSRRLANPVRDFLRALTATTAEARPRRASADDMVLEHLAASCVRVGLLQTLAGGGIDSPSHTITDLCRSLNTKSRRLVVTELEYLHANGLVEQTKEEKRAFWRMSSRGHTFFQKLAATCPNIAE
jgi:hypothetical protein